MLGERIGEVSGKTVLERVLPSDGGVPKMEVTFQAAGSLLGVPSQDRGTYWAALRPDGTLYGEGQGITMSAQGDAATWKGSGVGRMKQDGSISYRGAIYLQTTSPKWAQLNSIAVLFEYEVDAQGNSRSTLYEWK
jgi:hypothetical protein